MQHGTTICEQTLKSPYGKGITGNCVAHEGTEEEREEHSRRAADLYYGYKFHQQRTHGRRIPVIVLKTKEREFSQNDRAHTLTC